MATESQARGLVRGLGVSLWLTADGSLSQFEVEGAIEILPPDSAKLGPSMDRVRLELAETAGNPVPTGAPVA